jgi:hypothetical protein
MVRVSKHRKLEHFVTSDSFLFCLGTLAISLSNDGELRTWSSSTPLTPQPLSNVSVHFEKYSYKCQEPQTNPLFAITNVRSHSYESFLFEKFIYLYF